MYLLGFILGLVLGSFIKALADRSLSSKSFWGRSYCQYCKHKLAWYDLFPVISYLTLKGKCRYCHKKVKGRFRRYALIFVIITAMMFFIATHKRDVDLFFYRVERVVKSVNSTFKTIKDIIFDLRDGVKAFKNYKQNTETVQSIKIND